MKYSTLGLMTKRSSRESSFTTQDNNYVDVTMDGMKKRSRSMSSSSIMLPLQSSFSHQLLMRLLTMNHGVFVISNCILRDVLIIVIPVSKEILKMPARYGTYRNGSGPV